MRVKVADKTWLEHLEVADTLWTRTKGLLGRSKLAPQSGLWIKRCNSIHTFFMQFPIDVVFLNKQMVVTKTISQVAPGRVILPVWRASSVIELSAGFLESHPLKVGEKLHVDPALS
jgi:uncharacterized membrane protein (UPF0127 family)